MANCLVTTLKESVGDSTITKLGELVIEKAKSAGILNFNIFPNTAITVTLIGDAYFTDSTGATNAGKTKTLTAGTHNPMHVSQGACKIKVSNKYTAAVWGIANARNISIDIADMIMGDSVLGFLDAYDSTIHGDLAAFKYSNSNAVRINLRGSDVKGDIEVFANWPNLDTLGIPLNATGSLTVISTLPSLKDLQMTNNKKVTGNLSMFAGKDMNGMDFGGSGIEGNLSSLSDMTNLTALYLWGTSVSGNLSSLSGLINLSTLYLHGCPNITGDTSSLANLTNLTTFTYTNTAITGTWPLT